MLNPQQQITSNAVIDWLRIDSEPFRLLDSSAGMGKTYLVNETICNAFKQSIFPKDAVIYTTALIHTAVNVIDQATPDIPNKGACTVHSLFALRPQKVYWSQKDDDLYQKLLAQKSETLSDEDSTKLHFLSIKLASHQERKIEFVQSKIPKTIKSIALIIVDEASQLNEYVFDTILNTIYEVRSEGYNTKVLFLGDRGQTAPVGEKESLVFTQIPQLPKLTEVVRYGGDILTLATAINTQPNYHNLHLTLSLEDETAITLSRDEILDKETIQDCYASSPDTMFVTSTNNAVDRLNQQVRRLLTSKRKLHYEVCDILLTNGSIYRDEEPNYCFGNVCLDESEYIFPSSTFVRLVREATQQDIDFYVGGFATHTQHNSFTNALGNTYERSYWIGVINNYVEKNPDGTTKPPEEKFICLIDPNQYIKWKQDNEELSKIAKSAFSTSKSQKRGQEGDTAKKAWKILGIKNWYKHLDGSEISYSEYRQYTNQLWGHFHANHRFSDPITYSYACTVHRIQGMGVDCVIADLQNILGISKPMWQKTATDDTWDVRKLYYTTVTRAKKQCILMI